MVTSMRAGAGGQVSLLVLQGTLTSYTMSKQSAPPIIPSPPIAAMPTCLPPPRHPPLTRGLNTFPFQLNLSSSLHHITQLNPECVLKLLKSSSNVKECKPLPFTRGSYIVAPAQSRGATWSSGASLGQGLTLVHFSAQRKHFMWDSLNGCSSV